MRWRITCIFLSIVGLVSAQGSIVGSFASNIIYNSIRLDWVIVAGSTCNGIDIQRSLDGISFNSIGHIEGICGNVAIPVSYDFLDVSPTLNADNYYRLELGSQGYSQVITQRIYGLNGNGFNFFPNPVESELHFVYGNPYDDDFEMRVYTVNGDEVLLFQNLIGDDAVLNMSSLKSGIYVFKASDSNRRFTYEGKFIKE